MSRGEGEEATSALISGLKQKNYGYLIEQTFHDDDMDPYHM
jgi:hypothetical protein